MSPKEALTEWQKLLIVSSWQKSPTHSPQAANNININNNNHSRSRSPISTTSRQSPIAYRRAPNTQRPRSAAATNNNSALPFLPSLIATAMQQIHTQRSRRSSASLLYMPTKLSDLSAAVLQIYPHLDLMLSPRGNNISRHNNSTKLMILEGITLAIGLICALSQEQLAQDLASQRGSPSVPETVEQALELARREYRLGGFVMKIKDVQESSLIEFEWIREMGDGGYPFRDQVYDWAYQKEGNSWSLLGIDTIDWLNSLVQGKKITIPASAPLLRSPAQYPPYQQNSQYIQSHSHQPSQIQSPLKSGMPVEPPTSAGEQAPASKVEEKKPSSPMDVDKTKDPTELNPPSAIHHPVDSLKAIQSTKSEDPLYPASLQVHTSAMPPIIQNAGNLKLDLRKSRAER